MDEVDEPIANVLSAHSGAEFEAGHVGSGNGDAPPAAIAGATIGSGGAPPDRPTTSAGANWFERRGQAAAAAPSPAAAPTEEAESSSTGSRRQAMRWSA